MNLTQEELKKYLHYSPETGIFTWEINNGNKAQKGTKAGYLTRMGYIHMTVNRKRYFAHRLAFLYMEGYLPENQVDHINRIRNDNRWCNLREVSCSCNHRNSTTKKTNTSGIKGVHWDTVNKKWRANIYPNKKHINLGRFITKLDAAKARWEAEKKYGYPNCNATSSAYQYIKESEKRVKT